jgi:hypothetical protein
MECTLDIKDWSWIPFPLTTPWPALPPALQKKNQHLKGNNNHVRWWSYTYMYFAYFQYQVKITCGWIVHRFFFVICRMTQKGALSTQLIDGSGLLLAWTIAGWWCRCFKVWTTILMDLHASRLNNWWVVVWVLQGLSNNWWICALLGWTIGGWWCGCFKAWATIDGSARF